MSFRQLFVSSTSACLELDNDSIYYNDQEYDILLNGKVYKKAQKANVFSVFGLAPNTEYTIKTSLEDFTLTIKTANESACLNVKDFFAKGDGVADDTNAIQNAISCCPPQGRVLVPQGVYSIRPITLKSDVTLELQKGARLQGSIKEEDYPLLPGEVDAPNGGKIQIATWEGNPLVCHKPLISSHFGCNLSIIGEGEIDGNAHNSTWWINHKDRELHRPRLLFLAHCQNVNIHGITGANSPAWNFHPYFSKNVSFYDVRLNAPKDSPNTDGINPEACDGVNIIGAVFSVGDDCIAIKSGKIYIGKTYQAPAKDHVIRNCLMQFGHGAVVLGSEIAGGVKNLTVNRCMFVKTDRGLRVKTRRGRGKHSIIDGILFEKIHMQNVLAPLVINMFYFCDPDGKTEYVWSKEKLPVDDRTPYLGSFTFKDIECHDCEQAAGYFHGLPEQPIAQISLQNVSFDFREDAEAGLPAMMSFIEPHRKCGLFFDNVKNIKLSNVTMRGHEGQKVITKTIDSIVEE